LGLAPFHDRDDAVRRAEGDADDLTHCSLAPPSMTLPLARRSRPWLRNRNFSHQGRPLGRESPGTGPHGHDFCAGTALISASKLITWRATSTAAAYFVIAFVTGGSEGRSVRWIAQRYSHW